VIFFVMRQAFANFGRLYLLMMGAVATIIMLWAPKRLWGLTAERIG
jgi:branched-chain amino acid transport system permease protein